MEVIIDYAPRPLQRVVHDAMPPKRFGALVCHRRFGKSVLGTNHLIRGALTCTRQRPRFGYIGPTYRQAKATVWDYAKYYSRPIPNVKVNESELRLDYPNGGQFRVYGGDDPDSLRGIYLDGVVVDEYGLHQGDIFTTVLRPALTDREGWALFLGTPNGKNQFYDICQHAKTDPTWFYAMFKASETGILNEAELAEARKVMTADEYAQEFECSFEASVKGAVFARELQAAREAGRLTRVPYDPVLPVDTDWDLGIGDATAIWFSQSLYTGEVRLIDYYEHHGEGLSHYKQILNDKTSKYGYAYGMHYAPHDIEVKEFGTGRSRLETARSLGLHFQVVPKTSLDDGVHNVRMLLPRCYFDLEKCQDGVECLQNYRWDYNTRIQEFKGLPVHDWASHGADAFRGLATRHLTPRAKKPAAREIYDVDPVERQQMVRRQRAGLGRGGYR